MKAGRKPQALTEKEKILMQMLWENGPMFVREMLEIYPEPKPHFNTISKNAVSALVEEEKISVDELREIIDLVESKNTPPSTPNS